MSRSLSGALGRNLEPVDAPQHQPFDSEPSGVVTVCQAVAGGVERAVALLVSAVMTVRTG